MDDETNERKSIEDKRKNLKISENVRRAKLEFLNANIENTYTTIWDSIVIEESIHDGANTYVKERIPIALNTGEQVTNDVEHQQRPSTTDLNASILTTDSSNDQFPSSTKSLSPKHLNKASAFSDGNFRSNLNRTLKNFKIDEHPGDYIGGHSDDHSNVNQFDDNYNDLNYDYLLNDFDKFRDNRPLSPTEVQLAKWKEIKRFKNRKINSNTDHHLPGEQDNQFAKSFEQTFDNSSNNFDKTFDEQTIEPPIEQRFYLENLNDPNYSSSPDQSLEQIPIEISDYYASVDDTNTRFSDLDKDIDEKSDDHLVDFEDNNQFEEQPDDLNYLSTRQAIDDLTPRSSIISELNEHNFIDELDKESDQVDNVSDDHQLDHQLNKSYLSSREEQFQQFNSPVHQTLNSNYKDLNTKEQIEQEFDNLFLDYPEIEKFVNNLNTPVSSSPLDNKFQESANNVYSSLGYGDKLPVIREPNRLSFQKENSIRIPGEVFDEPLIKRQPNQSTAGQKVKRRSVIVQTSRPVSLMSDGDEEIKHLLTIVRNDRLKQCVPVKDVYVINRTVYQIQKLSSFIVEYRYLRNCIQKRLHHQLFSKTMEDSNQAPTSVQKKSTTDSENKWSHIKLILKWIIAHLFSTPGLCFVLICYCLIGAFLFELFERQNNLEEIKRMMIYRNETVYNLFELNSHNLNKREWIRQANEYLKTYEKVVIDKVEMNGYSGNASDKWNYSDSFLFSVTVISTIGYGKLSPKTLAGQLTTIIYAVVGIPIMLLFITNLGGLMASLFRVSYDTFCCYLCNLGKEDQSQTNENQNNSNAPMTVSEQLTDPKSVEMNETIQKQSNQPPADDSENLASPKSQDQNLETDSIVVFQNNEYRTNVTERAYYLTYNSDPIHRNRVPIRIVVLIVICYICFGGLLFSAWESNSKDEKTGNDFFKWSYFCFITLSTIGFGDLVPGDSIKLTKDFEGTAQILFCCVYLILGLALIAMCFSLAQERVILKMRKLYESLGMDAPRRTINY